MLRPLLIVLSFLLASGCGSTVTIAPADAGADHPPAIDVADEPLPDVTLDIPTADVGPDVPPPQPCSLSTCARGWLVSLDGATHCEPGGEQTPIGTPCEEGRFCDGRGGCTLVQRSCPDPTELGCGVQALPAGQFEMGRGSEPGGLAEGARYRTQVSLHPFRLDVYEVTWRRFQRWVAAGRPTPDVIRYPRGEIPFNRLATLDRTCWGPAPVSDLEAACGNYWMAQAFCAWDGGRLPTEAEWEYAAVGVQDGRPTPRLYPWGDQDPSDDCTLADWSARTMRGPAPQPSCEPELYWRPVGRVRPYGGIHDMAGGRSEWMADLFPYRDIWICPLAPMEGSDLRLDPLCVNLDPSNAMIHGGDRVGELFPSMKSASRFSAVPNLTTTGFRCARSD